MEDFLLQFSSLPKKFIVDFYSIADENHNDTDMIIDLDIAVKWLAITKGNLKRLLISDFAEGSDYDIKKVKIKHTNSTGATIKENIFISSQCFKEICMLSRTDKAKEVRKYFLEMEKLVKKYHVIVKEQLLKQIGLLKGNQKSKANVKGGVIYVLEAQNNISSQQLDSILYKVGKTEDIKKRLKVYNTGNANDIEPLFIMKVDDVEKVEKCVKMIAKQHQYRKYKEVYEIDFDVLKQVIASCDEFTDAMKNFMEKNKKKDTIAKLSRMKAGKNSMFIVFEKQ
jgi:phage anti-repressor protein